jgi:Domain of unknown function (DUF6468)
MSPIALGLDVLLAALLMSALVLGMRLNGRLKALRDSQASFVEAVADVDQAAARAQAGLADLRSASESTHDQLLTRIETARSLLLKLEHASLSAERVLSAAPAPQAAPGGRSLAAIAALADGRTPPPPSVSRRSESVRSPLTPPPARTRPPARSAFDEDLFDPDAPLDLGPLRGRKDDRR